MEWAGSGHFVLLLSRCIKIISILFPFAIKSISGWPGRTFPHKTSGRTNCLLKAAGS